MVRKHSLFSGTLVSLLLVSILTFAQSQVAEVRNHTIKIVFGATGKIPKTKQITLKSSVSNVVIKCVKGNSTESNDRIGNESLLNYGGGDVDELISEVGWRKPSAALRKVYDKAKMWRYLLEHGAPGQVQRLRQDSWNQSDAPLLTIGLNADGTEGFSFSLEQLLEKGAIWLPEHDIFLTFADKPIRFKQHLSSLKGERVLDRVKKGPDASLEQFKKLWSDFGNPLVYDEPWQTEYKGTTGHLMVTAAAHGSIYKFVVDRWGKVRPDFASPHKFRMDPVWAGSQWKGQRIENGLPVIVTSLENNQQLCEMQQFAAPLGDIDAAIRGYVSSVFFTRMIISGKPGPIDFAIDFNNESGDRQMKIEEFDGGLRVVEKETGNILLMVEAESPLSVHLNEREERDKVQEILLRVTGELSAGQVREIVVKMPSPAIAPSQTAKLKALDFSVAKHKVIDYWEKWLAEGAHFQVPEEAVNELVRANLWHALILPRHTYGANGKPHMDLPYANTAYGQVNSDWPVNQAVYVDYMIYGLRGYEQVAEDEFVAMFNSQQQPDGRIGGFANWGVYSPAQLYAIAQNYLLSGDRQRFERLLPNSLKTLDWCLARIKESNSRRNNTSLIMGPLNDLSVGEREWAFTQAYYVGGLELFARALSHLNHPRAEEVRRVSSEMKQAVVKEFARSSVKSAVVQLEDGTWINYVPTDATTPRRMLDEWYPTDVDTGPLHLARLGVVGPHSWLTTSMLHDHEDNLFLNNKGAANEPVYVQQANAYLLRDEPKAVIRSFYSFMACGFSHKQYSPLEHRWAHPQYYGPPSTDGAWFEILRKMLINELGNDTLMIGQAIPRKWFEIGKQIQVKNAPSYFGEVSFEIDGESSSGEIVATMELALRTKPSSLLVRFRHPNKKPIRSVNVNGKVWKNFDVAREQVIIPDPIENTYVIKAVY
jgi:hypothetical protein